MLGSVPADGDPEQRFVPGGKRGHYPIGVPGSDCDRNGLCSCGELSCPDVADVPAGEDRHLCGGPVRSDPKLFFVDVSGEPYGYGQEKYMVCITQMQLKQVKG